MLQKHKTIATKILNDRRLFLFLPFAFVIITVLIAGLDNRLQLSKPLSCEVNSKAMPGKVISGRLILEKTCTTFATALRPGSRGTDKTQPVKTSSAIIAAHNKKIKLKGNIVDKGFISIFTFPLIKGSPKTDSVFAHANNKSSASQPG